MLAQLNDCIGGLLHLGPNVITFRALLHLGPNVITFRTLLHLGQLLHLGLQHGPRFQFHWASIGSRIFDQVMIKAERDLTLLSPTKRARKQRDFSRYRY